MRTATESPKAQITGNGVTTAIPFNFNFYLSTDLAVYRKVISTGVESLVSPTEYTVSGGGGSTGTVTFLVAPTSDHRITVLLAVPFEQAADYVSNEGFPADEHEKQVDKIVAMCQQLAERVNRALKFTRSFSGTVPDFPDLVASRYLYNDGTTLSWKELVLTALTYNGTIGFGADASKPASPSVGDLYFATDTFKLHRCNSGGVWSTRQVFGHAVDFAKGADIASATTTDIGAATGNFVDITGTTTITGLGTIQAGTLRWVRFTGILTLTHNATSLILPTGASITTAAGDTALFVSLGSGNWRCLFYNRASGKALVTSFVPSASNAIAGNVIQSRRYETGAMIDCPNATPAAMDNSAPTNGEGDQVMTDSFTPLLDNSRIRITIEVNGCFESTTNGLFWLLLGADTEARKVGVMSGAPGILFSTGRMSFEYAPGSASAITAYVRAGQPSTGYHFTFNGVGAAAKMNTKLLSSITWEEIKV